MRTLQSLQRTVDDMREGRLGAADLKRLMHHDAALIRVNAIRALAAQYPSAQTVKELVSTAMDPANQVRLLGAVLVSHVAFGCLVSLSRKDASNAVRRLLRSWPNDDRDDLIHYLRTEGLQIPEVATTVS